MPDERPLKVVAAVAGLELDAVVGPLVSVHRTVASFTPVAGTAEDVRVMVV